MTRAILQLFAALGLWMGASVAGAGEVCGALQNAYGPFDYRTATESQKHMVESYHFTSDVERLRKGSTGTIAGDLNYTLRVFPNHPRALLAMMKLGFRDRTIRPEGADWPIECYFDRAVRYAPDDPGVHTIYALFLIGMGDKKNAPRELEAAREELEKLGGDANLNYNLGLAYFEIADYAKAMEQAKIAYDLGFPLPGLRDKLKRAGKWKD